ncbi:MAG TPA: FAD-dependent oxidoreductase [Vicinamibacteria bacterium]|nr:FAD-dependent oxidoreductase [Vicinamibacteria bacterium]
MDRRKFIKTAGASAGAIAIGRGVDANAANRAPESAGSQSTMGSRSDVTADVAVVGAGVMGNWTALNLREMGLSVVLIDQYSPGNSKSSSMGEVRGMRLTYGEEEHEMLWARNACELWKMRQAEFGTDMFYQCGALAFRSQWTARNSAERALFDKHRVPYEVISYDDLMRRWPQAPPPSEEFFGFYHPWGGVLSPRDANLAVATSFRKKGGSLLIDKASPGARAGGKLQSVTLTSGATVSADTFVFALGAWMPKVFPEVMKNKLSVRKAAYYMYGTPPGDNRFSVPNLPNTGLGLPSINGAGFGLLISPGEEVDPDLFERVPNADEKAAARETLAQRFPALKDQPMLAAWSCQTENSVDGQCFFDLHPEMDNLWLVGGGSWHAFKIGPVIGDYVAHRVVGEKKGLPEAGLSGEALAAIFKLKPETFG